MPTTYTLSQLRGQTIFPSGTLFQLAATPDLPSQMVALIGTLDEAAPPELRAARRTLQDFSKDFGNSATKRRIAAALCAALAEVK